MYRRLAWYFRTWAPAVLAANGDPVLEDIAMQRPGVRFARSEYDRLLAALDQEQRQDRDAALALTLILRTRCACASPST